MLSVSEIPAEIPAAVAIDHRHLVMPQALHVVFAEEESSVVDEESSDLRFPEGEYQAACPILTFELSSGERRGVGAFGRKQAVEFDEVTVEFSAGRDGVIHFGREEIGAVVAEARRAGELRHRQRLNGVDTQFGKVFELQHDI